MAERLRVTICDGKYTVIQPEGGGLTFLRDGEPWDYRGFRDFAGGGLILALAQEVDAVRTERDRLKCALDVLRSALRSGSGASG